MQAAEGLDVALLQRAARLEADLPAVLLHDTADLHRGIWSAFVEDLGTARAALGRCADKAKVSGDDYPLSIFLSYLATVEELAGDFSAAAARLEAERAVAQWHDWPQSAWHVKPRCDLLIAAGSLDEAVQIADTHLPDDESVTTAARFAGAAVRGKVCAWRGDLHNAVRHLERAAVYAGEMEWRDPGLRDRVDVELAEAYVGLGRPDDARPVASWLRDLGGRLSRPALLGDADRIDALVQSGHRAPGRPHHDVELMDASGRVLARARLPEGAAGMTRLHAMIGEQFGEDADDASVQVQVGIETDRGLWVQALVAAGYVVFGINPLQTSRYRERHAVSGAKSDTGDAHGAGGHGAH